MSPHDEQVELPIATRTGLTADELYNLALGESVWPHEKRVVYCSVTGKPWCKVSEECVKEVILAVGANSPQLEVMIDRMILFNGPSPLWQSKVHNGLVQNKMLDPAGFLVYLISGTVMKKIYEKNARQAGDLDYEVNWRKQMVKLYASYMRMEHSFLDAINDSILAVSAEGYIAPPHLLPSQNLLDYADKDMLNKLCITLRKQYKYVKVDGVTYGLQRTTAPRPKNFIHQRTVDKAYGLDALDDITARRMRDLMLISMVRKLDMNMTAHERAIAKEMIGVDSPMLAEFKRLEKAMPDMVTGKALQPKPAKFSVGTAPKFSFMKKV